MTTAAISNLLNKAGIPSRCSDHAPNNGLRPRQEEDITKWITGWKPVPHIFSSPLANLGDRRSVEIGKDFFHV